MHDRADSNRLPHNIACLTLIASFLVTSCGFAGGSDSPEAGSAGFELAQLEVEKEALLPGAQAGAVSPSDNLGSPASSADAPGPDAAPGGSAVPESSTPGSANPGSVAPDSSGAPDSYTPPTAVAPKATGTASRPLYILLTGDSMTRGDEHNPTGARAFRGRLYYMLTNAGIHVDFLGAQNERPAIGGDPNHDAWGGAWIGPGGSSRNIYDQMPTVLGPTVNPDIIVMALGWNSVVYEPAIAADKYEGLVNRIAALKPKAQLVLGTQSPYRGNTEAVTASYERGYRELNQRARTLAAASASDQFHLTDLASGDYFTSDYIDAVHWNQSGADKAAKIVFDTIVKKVLPQLP